MYPAINVLNSQSDGWFIPKESWAYSASDSPVFTVITAGDVRSLYSEGMRVSLRQNTGGLKYFIIVGISFSGGNTGLILYGGTDYTLNNEAILNLRFSMMKAPLGFPLDVIKWTIKVVDTINRSQGSPSNATWYNVGGG